MSMEHCHCNTVTSEHRRLFAKNINPPPYCLKVSVGTKRGKTLQPYSPIWVCQLQMCLKLAAGVHPSYWARNSRERGIYLGVVDANCLLVQHTALAKNGVPLTKKVQYIRGTGEYCWKKKVQWGRTPEVQQLFFSVRRLTGHVHKTQTEHSTRQCHLGSCRGKLKW